MFSVTFGMVLGFAATGTFAAQPSEVELMKQAKITKGKAEQIALAKVSHGIVKSAEIEKEKEQARQRTAEDEKLLAEWRAKRDQLRSGVREDLLRHRATRHTRHH